LPVTIKNLIDRQYKHVDKNILFTYKTSFITTATIKHGFKDRFSAFVGKF